MAGDLSNVTRCFYEVLGVERDADYDQIRSAYKKRALKWHPDKNVGNEAEATERFKEIKNAYTVLSTPTERAWYDSHREAILAGGDGTDAADAIDLTSLWSYFGPSCYSGFGDDAGGFYAVFRGLFETLHAEEVKLSSGEQGDAPGFGSPDSPWSEVKAFYDHWGGFTSRMTFSWADKHDIREAPNRRYRRAMEAENKVARDAARKERNSEVRALTEHVRRLDRRVIAHHIEVRKAQDRARKAKEARQREERAARAVLRAKEAELRAAEYEADMALPEELRPFRLAGESGGSDSEEEETRTLLVCQLCNKSFKTENQWRAHEKSKKHKQKMAKAGGGGGGGGTGSTARGSRGGKGRKAANGAAGAADSRRGAAGGAGVGSDDGGDGDGDGDFDFDDPLMDDLIDDFEALGGEDDSAADGGDRDHGADDAGGADEVKAGDVDDDDDHAAAQEAQRGGGAAEWFELGDGRLPPSDSEDSDEGDLADLASHLAARFSGGGVDGGDVAGADSDSDSEADAEGLSGPAAVAPAPEAAVDAPAPADDDGPGEEGAPVEAATPSGEAEAGAAAAAAGGDDAATDSTSATPSKAAATDKAAAAQQRRDARRAKRKQKKAQKGGGGSAAPGAPGAAADAPKPQLCAICGVTFPSKNQLFKHIKKTGHAAIKTELAGAKAAAAAGAAAAGDAPSDDDFDGRRRKGKGKGKGRRRQ